MKKITFLIFTILLIFQNCSGQTSDNKFYNKDFKWSIVIPPNYLKVSQEEWSKKQQRGKVAIEKTTGQEVINEAKIIFVFKADDMNYFEANYQPFDPQIDGDYLESVKMVNNTLYQTFKQNIPNAKIDTLNTTEKINNLVFQKSETKIQLPNNMILTTIMYNRLFDKGEFTANLIFVDPKRGKEMVEAWKNSIFGK